MYYKTFHMFKKTEESTNKLTKYFKVFEAMAEIFSNFIKTLYPQI